MAVGGKGLAVPKRIDQGRPVDREAEGLADSLVLQHRMLGVVDQDVGIVEDNALVADLRFVAFQNLNAVRRNVDDDVELTAD